MWFHLYEISRTEQSRETESGFMVAKGWAEGHEDWLLMDMGGGVFFVGDDGRGDEKVLKLVVIVVQFCDYINDLLLTLKECIYGMWIICQ